MALIWVQICSSGGQYENSSSPVGDGGHYGWWRFAAAAVVACLLLGNATATFLLLPVTYLLWLPNLRPAESTIFHMATCFQDWLHCLLIGPKQSCNPVILSRDWFGHGHVTQFWPMTCARNNSRELLGKVSSLLKIRMEKISPVSVFRHHHAYVWHIELLQMSCSRAR